MTIPLSRRSALASLAWLVMAKGAFAQQGAAISNVRVEVSAMQGIPGVALADWIRQALPGDLQQAFARQWTPRGGGTLVAHISSVQLGLIVSRGDGGSGNSYTDSMGGDVALLDPAGRLIAQADFFTTRPTPTGATPLSIRAQRISVDSICERFAYFAPSQLGM